MAAKLCDFSIENIRNLEWEKRNINEVSQRCSKIDKSLKITMKVPKDVIYQSRRAPKFLAAILVLILVNSRWPPFWWDKFSFCHKLITSVYKMLFLVSKFMFSQSRSSLAKNKTYLSTIYHHNPRWPPNCVTFP